MIASEWSLPTQMDNHDNKQDILSIKKRLREDPQDPSILYELGSALVLESQPAEALEVFLACFDSGLEHSPAFSGVRRSYLLDDIARLAELHSPALSALQERLARARAAVLVAPCVAEQEAQAGMEFHKLMDRRQRPRREAARDLVALARVLGEEEQVVEVYHLVRACWCAEGWKRSGQGQEQLVRLLDNPFKTMREGAHKALVELRRYQEVVADSDDHAGELRSAIMRSEQSLNRHQRRPRPKGLAQETTEMYRKRVVWDASTVYEAMVGTPGHDPVAAEYLALILEFDSSPHTWSAVLDSAVRAGRTELAGELHKTAVRTLPVDQRVDLPWPLP